MEFFSEPHKIPHDLHHIINENMISSYFAALTQVDDPGTHLRSDSQEHHTVLVSSTDLVLLLELVFQNQTCDPNFMQLVKVVQPAVAVLQEGMQFMVVEVGDEEVVQSRHSLSNGPSFSNLSGRNSNNRRSEADDEDRVEVDDETIQLSKVAMTRATRTSRRGMLLAASSPLAESPSVPNISSTTLVSSAPTPPTPVLISDAHLVRTAKQNLRLALSVLDPVCGPIHLPIEDLLLLQCGRNLSFDAHVMEAHVSEVDLITTSH